MVKANVATLGTEMSSLMEELPIVGSRVSNIHSALTHIAPHVRFPAAPKNPRPPDGGNNDPDPNPPLDSEEYNDGCDGYTNARGIDNCPKTAANRPGPQNNASAASSGRPANLSVNTPTANQRPHPLFPNAAPPPTQVSDSHSPARPWQNQPNPPTNPYTPSRPYNRDSQRVHYGDKDSSEAELMLSRRISSPWHINRRRQAFTSRTSPFDIGGLANTKYHGDLDGYLPLTPGIIHNCGFTEIDTSDVISSYSEIILVHKTIIANWKGKFTSGPQIDCILKKGMPSFPRLQSPMTVEAAVDWYNLLQMTLLIYLIPITPLDCIMIKMGYEALCIPGTGLS
jgi:hypothetical protein